MANEDEAEDQGGAFLHADGFDETVAADDKLLGLDIDLTDPAECKFDSDGVHVSVANGVVLRGRYSLVQKLGQQIVDHLYQRGQYDGKLSTIQIQITEVINGFKPPILVEIVSQGTFDGEPFIFTSRAYRRHVKPGGSMISRILLRVADMVQSEKPLRKLPLQFCMEQCAADICLQLDKVAKFAETGAPLLYRRLSVGQWILASLAAVYMGWSFWRARPEQKMSDMLFLAGLAGLCTVFVIQGLLGLLTPRSFFDESPRGKREMARLNIESFFVYRLKYIFRLIVFSTIGVLLLVG